MMKLVYADKADCPEITGSIHPNDFPEGWREITSEEFAQSDFFMYSPTHIEYRQMYDKNVPSKPMTAAKLFHFHDGTGIAMSQDYWNKKVLYFKFGCDHKYNELSRQECGTRGFQHHGMCWHVYECAECGNIMSQDSSD